jgi:outer membrane receptor protein involved in Fe transport
MSSKQPQPRLLSVAVLAALAAMPAAPALAQEAPPAQREAKTLDTLVVTAQKREEALQDVPVVVTALSREALDDAGVRDVKDLQVLVPGLTVTSTQSEALTTARIRGIGTVGDNVGLESSVGVVIDGVYRPRNGVGFGDLGELERIEVLKGPQGTLFGKNTSAGVINVVTRRPGFEPEAEVELTAGNYGSMGVAGSLNLPLGKDAAFRVYAAQRARDGFLDVHTGNGPRTETDDGNRDFGTARAQLRWDAADSLTLNLAADVTNRTEDCCAGVTIIRGPTAAIIDALAPDSGVAPVADPYAREAWSNRSTAQHIRDRGLSLQADWTTPWFGGATLTSITASRQWSSANGLDFDFSTADLLYREPSEADNYSAFDTFSQELRLAGASERVDWLVGAFYSDERLDRNEGYRVGAAYEPYLSIAILGRINPALAASPTAPLFLSQASGRPFGSVFLGHAAADTYRQQARSLALFTNDTWHVTDALDLTAGLRWTRDDKSLDSRYSNPNGGLGCGAMMANPAQVVSALVARGLTVGQASAAAPTVIGFACLPWVNPRHDGRATEQDLGDSAWSGTVKAAYRWNPHVMTYASAARGYKGGGFNLDRVQSNTGLSGGTSGITPVDDTSFPAETVDSYELGAKTTWLGGNLLLNATLFHQAYSDFQLNSFLGTSFVVRSIPSATSRGLDAEALFQRGGLFLQGGATYADTRYGDDPLPDADLALLPGSTASFAPRWSLTAAMAYEFGLGDLLARLHLGAKHMTDYNTGSDLDPEKRQPGFTTVDARISLGGPRRDWTVELWAQNLTDAEYMQVAFDAPLQTGSWNAFLGQPRTWGVTLRWRY